MSYDSSLRRTLTGINTIKDLMKMNLKRLMGVYGLWVKILVSSSDTGTRLEHESGDI